MTELDTTEAVAQRLANFNTRKASPEYMRNNIVPAIIATYRSCQEANGFVEVKIGTVPPWMKDEGSIASWASCMEGVSESMYKDERRLYSIAIELDES